MATVDLFRQYAEKALRQAAQSNNEKEQLALIELVRTWTRAAEATSESAMVFNDSPPEHRAP
jgi:site-specific recombinase